MKMRSDRKLMLNTETIRHLRALKMEDLRRVQGGETHPCTGECTSTKKIVDPGV